MIRQVPRMAPRILLSSKEFIEKGSRGGANRQGTAAKVSAAADRYRFASALATRISAAAHAPFVQVGAGNRCPTPSSSSPPAWPRPACPASPWPISRGLPMIVHVLRRAQAAGNRRGGGGDRFGSGRRGGGKVGRPRHHDARRSRLRLRPHFRGAGRRSIPSAASTSWSMCRATCRPSSPPTSAPRSRRSPIRRSTSRRSPR